MTPTDFAIALLVGLGAPVNGANVSGLLSWMNAEGGHWNNTATYNPLNTTLPYGGSSTMSGGNTAGVQAYGSWADGLAATLRTLNGGSRYASIISALKSTSGCSTLAGAVAASPWGTGGYSCNKSVTDAQVAQAQADPGASITPTTGGSGGASATDVLNLGPVLASGAYGILGLSGKAATSTAGAVATPIYNDFKKFSLISLGIAAGLGLVVYGIVIMADKPVAKAESEINPLSAMGGGGAEAAAV